MKRIVFLFCIIFMLLSLCSCEAQHLQALLGGGNVEHNNTVRDIYDGYKEKIGQIEMSGITIQLDDKIVYTGYSNKPDQNPDQFCFYCFDLSTHEIECLGSIKKVYGLRSYENVFYNDHVYILISLGNPNKSSVDEVAVVDVDLINKNAKKIYSNKNGCVYDTLELSNDKLLISHLGSDNISSIVEYDIETKEQKTVIKEDISKGNVIRSMSFDNDALYVLRVLYNEDHSKKQLFLDTYDLDYNRLSSTDLKDIFDSEWQSIFDETDQIVAEFRVSNGYMYYQNKSLTRFLGRINKDNSIEKIVIDSKGELNIAAKSNKNDTSFLFLKKENDSSPNKLFLFDSTNGSAKECILGEDEEGYHISGATKNINDHITLNLSVNNDPELEGLPGKIYYLSISDLDFKDIDASDIEAELQ